MNSKKFVKVMAFVLALVMVLGLVPAVMTIF